MPQIFPSVLAVILIFLAGPAPGFAAPPEPVPVGLHQIADAALVPLWSATYNSGPEAIDGAIELTYADGTLLVVGRGFGATGSFDYVSVAHDAETGAELWVARYDGPANGGEHPHGIAADGGRVFVTGQSAGIGTSTDYATVAYDASTGEELWVARYNGPTNSVDNAYDVLAANGLVYVTGESRGPNAADFNTIAYDAATGTMVWAARYNGPYDVSGGSDVPREMALVDGRLYVGGDSRTDFVSGIDPTVVAYDAATGAELWVARQPLSTAHDVVFGLAVGDGMVALAGTAGGTDAAGDFGTAVFDAVTGAPLWTARYDGPGTAGDSARDVAVAGGAVFVTGRSIPVVNAGGGLVTADDYATVAYDAQTGAVLWVSHYDGPTSGFDYAEAIGVADGRVYVTGGSMKGPGLHQDAPIGSHDYATLVYDAATGALLWVAREVAVGASSASDVLVVGDRVFVTGGLAINPLDNHDFGTFAYVVGLGG